MPVELHHERQVKQMCLVHALNSLLQRKEFTSKDLDRICYSLNENRWFNPHKSILGLGNYDVNVLMVALDKCDLHMVWFDSRRPISDINLDAVDAMIFNVPSGRIPCWPGRHWFTVLKVEDGSFMNMDSFLPVPKEVDNICTFTEQLFQNEQKGNID
ncbi:unnamed protein product [Auanema sp. JU1783]|nr:unnamed protein product [Auanema sp. JU1783]